MFFVWYKSKMHRGVNGPWRHKSSYRVHSSIVFVSFLINYVRNLAQILLQEVDEVLRASSTSSEYLSIKTSTESTHPFEDIQDMISYILNGYMTTFCFATGTLLNIFCIIIFLHYRHGSTPVIHYYLVSFINLNSTWVINYWVCILMPQVDMPLMAALCQPRPELSWSEWQRFYQ